MRLEFVFRFVDLEIWLVVLFKSVMMAGNDWLLSPRGSLLYILQSVLIIDKRRLLSHCVSGSRSLSTVRFDHGRILQVR